MTNRRFECFVTAARDLHIGRAAERLGIAQPALSQQIRALEQSVGARLLRRVGRGIALTEAGAAFLPEAVAALEQEARAVHVARRAARGELGEISIGYVNTAMLGPELPTLLSAFRRSVPDARIDLQEISVQDQLPALEQRRLDLAVVREPVGSLPPDYRARHFSRDALLAAVPLSLAERLPHPLPLAELAEQTFVALRDPHGMGLGHRLWQLCREAGFTPRIELRVNNATSILGLVAAGFGVSLVPAVLRRVGMAGVALLELKEAEAHTDLAIVHRPADTSPLKLRFLAQLPPDGDVFLQPRDIG
ncbi:LysR family transcriptional regulator [Roseomonas gilardii subsp. gilardii]|uniref:LysR family transcriptional regulator n=1 Tax=Roseomonas gilardii TaxID=257708 RepID=UPI001FFC296B|nr:LysR family transcriptional regulator [Roseomonas gilardii]UPG74025.1 LysR family transcriptional regulator [Roseomonas gilardii subsp. gilardii]